jgi:hypothetical protein|tara:strand:- start:19 stop:531 length:513 start_codon:yes stop_codon:yes gene_type:complete
MVFGGSKRLKQEKDRAKKEFDEAMGLKGDSKQEIAFRLKVGLRIRSAIDKTFVEGAVKFEKYAELCLAAIAAGEEKPEPPKSINFQKIKSVNGEVFAYLPSDSADTIFQLGGKYQNLDIDAKTAIRRVQVIANQFTYDLDLATPLVALQFLRDELEEAGTPYKETDEEED